MFIPPLCHIPGSFTNVTWGKKQSKQMKKVKSESLMLSSREPNKWKSSNHQQEYNKDNAIKKKKDKKKKERKKIARKLYASYSFKPAKYAPAYNGT